MLDWLASQIADIHWPTAIRMTVLFGAAGFAAKLPDEFVYQQERRRERRAADLDRHRTVAKRMELVG